MIYILQVGIDEITIVLQLPKAEKKSLLSFEWKEIAESIISEFLKLSCFTNIYGEASYTEHSLPEGYNRGYLFDKRPFYLAVAYHECQPSMGVVVKLSAQALDYYVFTQSVFPYELLQRIISDKYDIRLSRIDLTLDYINEPIDITAIYNDVSSEKVAVFREYQINGETVNRKIKMKLSGIADNDAFSTIYLGSPKSDSRLRIYDKKTEQIKKHGNKYDLALKYSNWTRFEGVFRGTYAHQLTEELIKICNREEYENLISCTMYQKYRFMNIEAGVALDETFYTELLADSITNNSIVLRSATVKNYDLVKNIRHLLYTSGTLTTLFKIKVIWGEDGLSKMISIILEELEDYQTNNDCHSWIQKHKEAYQKAYPDFYDYIDSVSNDSEKHPLY